MRVATRMTVMVCIVALGLSQQCTTRRGTDGDKTGPEGTYLDDPLLLAFSDYIQPTEESEHQFVFDLSEDTLVQRGRCNDIFLRYVTSSTCDEDVEVWSNHEHRWRHVAYAPPESALVICFGSFREQRHIFSAFGVDVESVLDDSLRLRLRTGRDVSGLAIRPLEVNPEYWTIPVSEEAPHGYWGLSHADGHFITMVGTKTALLAELDHTGGVLRTLPPVIEPFGITWDGEYLWLIGVPDTLYQVDWEGNVVCKFAAPTISTGDLAWDGTTVWLTEWQSASPWIWALDPVASCASGRAVVVDSFPRPGGYLNGPGVAWDGEHLLVTCENHMLYRLIRDGTVVDSCWLPVPADGVGATWDGDRICLLANGLNGVYTEEVIIACFKVRW